MTSSEPQPIAPRLSEAQRSLIARVCLRVPPLFPLEDMVAVNPFLGYASEPFVTAHAAFERRLHVDILPDIATFRRMFADGGFAISDVYAAAREWNGAVHPASGMPEIDPTLALEWLDGDTAILEHEPRGVRVLSIAEQLDREHDLGLLDAIVGDVSALCASFTDEGLARYRAPSAKPSLFATFRALARHDHSMTARGIDGFEALVASLPADVDDALAYAIEALNVTDGLLEDYLGRLLGELQGWAGALRCDAYRSDHGSIGALPDLLAIRLTYELLLARWRGPDVHGRPVRPGLLAGNASQKHPGARHDVALRAVLLAAAENGYRRRLLGRLHGAEVWMRAHAERTRPDVQAVFCIDVRSGPLRQALEEERAMETYGFAGFFGMPIAVSDPNLDRARPQCPVLLTPRYEIPIASADGSRALGSRLSRLAQSMRTTANGCFTYMESLGLAAVVPLLRQSFGLAAPCDAPHETGALVLDHLAPADRIALAASALDNLGLRSPYAPLVLLCAHDAVAANNPQRAGLSCGACAGHGGAPNARLLAKLLNDDDVREGLAERGVFLPNDTIVVAAVHDTMTDRVRILDRASIPGSHTEALGRLERALERASSASRGQRVKGLPGLARGVDDHLLEDVLRARASDWSEVRPEWALAGNAAFLAARRTRSRGVDLEGRVFLHDYDASRDEDGRVLELILTAPVVVASFINLAYYGASVSPSVLGSGNKTIHNVTAGIGVVQGSTGDLAVGLAWQSVHDGTRARHEPLRLQVFIEDTTARVDAVLARHASLRNLVHNGYIALHTLDPHSDACMRLVPLRGWCETVATKAD